MVFSINDEETNRLARAVAAATGESITEAVRSALRKRLAEVEDVQNQQAYIDRLLQIGRECAAEMEPPFQSSDHAALLYDENGLPK